MPTPHALTCRLLLALAAAVAGSSDAAAQAGGTWSGNGHTYEFRVRPAGLDWFAAQGECALDGGYLATSTSLAESDFIYSLIDPQLGDSVWLGGFQPTGSAEPGGGWQWVTSEAMSFSNWYPGEPNNGAGLGGEDGVALIRFPGGPVQSQWNDIPRTLPLRGYVFESELATSYCVAGTSASGCAATLWAVGTPSATLSAGFVITAGGVEGNKDGLFFFGTSGRQANAWGNGTSFQCVVPPVKRAGLLAGSGSPGACDGGFKQDFNARWCPSCPKPGQNPGAGAVVQAQLWYRDPINTSNQTTSLSDALEFTLTP